MTEPTSNQLKEARKISEALSILSAKDIAVFIAHIRREARNAALEEAAKICKREEGLMTSAGLEHPEDSASRDRCFARARMSLAIYRAIRALKDQP